MSVSVLVLHTSHFIILSTWRMGDEYMHSELTVSTWRMGGENASRDDGTVDMLQKVLEGGQWLDLQWSSRR